MSNRPIDLGRGEALTAQELRVASLAAAGLPLDESLVVMGTYDVSDMPARIAAKDRSDSPGGGGIAPSSRRNTSETR